MFWLLVALGLAAGAAAVWAVGLAVVYGYAWVQLGADDVVAPAQMDTAAGTRARAPSDAVTVLLVVTDERDPTRTRPPDLVGDPLLVQFGGRREVPVALALPRGLEITVDGGGRTSLESAYTRLGVDGLAEPVADYTEVRVDHVVAVSIELLARLTEVVGDVEVCGTDGCERRDGAAVRAALTDVDGRRFVETLWAHVAPLAESVDRRWAVTHPLDAWRVVDLAATQLVTDVPLRGSRPLALLAAVARTPRLDADVVPVLHDGASGDPLASPEAAMVRFQHLRDGTPFTEPAPDAAELRDDLLARTEVAVLNGAGVDGLAGDVAAALTSAGYNVVGTGNAASFDAAATVVHHVDDDAAVSMVAQQLAEELGNVRREPLAAVPEFDGEAVDVLVTVGEDHAQ